MQDKIREMVLEQFLVELKQTLDGSRTFKKIIPVNWDGKEQSLFVCGTAHAHFEDGHCIAVLNPEPQLVEEIQAGCYYPKATLKRLVAGRCDVMEDIWIDSYKQDPIGEIATYKRRTAM